MVGLQEDGIEVSRHDKRPEPVDLPVQDLAQGIDDVEGEIKDQDLLERVAFDKLRTAEDDARKANMKNTRTALPTRKNAAPMRAWNVIFQAFTARRKNIVMFFFRLSIWPSTMN
jgi:hypothetical protein